jgi:hypothetical protein
MVAMISLPSGSYKAIEKEYKLNEIIGANITEEIVNKKITEVRRSSSRS